MRIRLFVGLVAAAALALPAAARAEDKAPSLVIKVKSIDGLLKDAKYLAELGGKGEELKQVDEMLKAYKNEQGLGGIDVSRPLGLYGSFAAEFEQSPIVLLVPIADEKAFLQFLGSFEIKPEKGEDGVYTVQNVPNVPVPLFFRFADKYAYICAADKGHLAKDKLLTPAKVLPDDDAVLSLTGNVADVPDLAKQLLLGGLENALGALKEKQNDNEPPAVTRVKGQLADGLAARVKMVLNDGESLSLRLAVDPQKDELSVDASFKAKSGSQLAKEMTAAGKGESLFGGLARATDAISASVTVSLPDEVKKALGPVVDELMKQGLEQEKDEVKKALAKAALEKVAPTLKAGEIDGAVSVRGPDAAGHYSVVGGLRVKEGKGLDSFLRDMVRNMPEKDRANVTLDAESAGEVKVHKLVIDNMDDEARKMFGANTLYLAVRDDALLVGLGPDGLAGVKAAAAARPSATGKLLNVTISMARAAGLEKKNEHAAKLAREVFGANPAGTDTVNFSATMTDAVKLRLVVKGKVIAFGAKTAEATEGAKK